MPLVAALFFIAMVSLAAAMHVPAQEAQRIQAVANVGATSALAYRESVINYLNSNPGFAGTVPDSSLTFIWGHVRDARWTNVVNGGALYVYESTPSNTPGLLDELYRKTMASYMVGRNASGFLVSAKGFGTGVVVPATVPNGAILIVGK
jgi:hypothetical protein